MANRKAKRKRQAAAQREARERRRGADRVATARSAGTQAAREAVCRRVALHDQGVLSAIRELRERRATWPEIAAWLNERGFPTPRAGGSWSAMAAWRIGKRHGLAGRLPLLAREGGRDPALGGWWHRRPEGEEWRSIVRQDQAILPVIRRMRDEGASWQAIADHLEESGVESPGDRQRRAVAWPWTATAAWRVGVRHGLAAVREEAGEEAETGPVMAAHIDISNVTRALDSLRALRVSEDEVLERLRPALVLAHARGVTFKTLRDHLAGYGIKASTRAVRWKVQGRPRHHGVP